MSDPDDGFAPCEWQYGGNMGPAPPVILARRDRIPFSCHDWMVLDDYMSRWRDELCEAEEGRAELNARYLAPAKLQAYARSRSDQPYALLSFRFPIGSIVSPQGLSLEELNGKEGVVAQFGRDRVGIKFLDRPVTALKPERLILIKEAALPTEGAKREATVDTEEAKRRRQERAAELQHREARQIVRRFVECLYEDTFPEMGDLHLFGVGGEYRARATEVLAVWQGAVKSGDICEDAMVGALLAGNMKDIFVEITEKLAKTTTPNSTYANELISNKFAGMEFDCI